MENQKLYLPYQIKALMPSDLYKVSDTLFGFQKEGHITYSKKNCEYLHLDVAIVEQCVQTLINLKLIEPETMDGGVYRFRINPAPLEVAKSIPLTDIPNKPLLKLSSEITFKETMKTKQPSNEELLAKIRELQAQLMQQVKENNDADGLPW